MNPRNPRIVEVLNEALAFELRVMNTYFLNARMLQGWGFPRLGGVFYDLSLDEMRDSDALVKRILMFGGRPKLTDFGSLEVGEDPLAMLRGALAGEYAAVSLFNDLARECRELGDQATASLFEASALDEERHADWFEGQLASIERIGLDNYLAAQVAAGDLDAPSGP